MEQTGPLTPLLIGRLNCDGFGTLVRTSDPTLSAISGNETNRPANDRPTSIVWFRSANDALASLDFEVWDLSPDGSLRSMA